MQISDVVDRYSILTLKLNRTDLDIYEEYKVFQEEVRLYDGIDPFLKELITVNGKIWDLESDIRRGKEKELGLEEVGRRALEIRNLNKERIKIKNEITEKYKEGYKEVKKSHRSE